MDGPGAVGELCLLEREVVAEEFETNQLLAADTGVQTGVRQGVRQGSGTYEQRPQKEPVPQPAQTQVAVLWQTRLQVYHPYFSELRRAVQETLQRHGWSTWTPAMTPPDSREDVAWNSVSRSELLSQFGDPLNLAGAVVGSALAKQLGDARLPFPVVAEAPNRRVPFASYDWTDETDTAMRRLLRQGCRQVAILKLRHDRSAASTLQPAAALENCDPATVHLHELPEPDGDHVLSHWLRDSYAIMRRFLDSGTRFDGLLIGDDFCAPGALMPWRDTVGPANVTCRSPLLPVRGCIKITYTVGRRRLLVLSNNACVLPSSDNSLSSSVTPWPCPR